MSGLQTDRGEADAQEGNTVSSSLHVVFCPMGQWRTFLRKPHWGDLSLRLINSTNVRALENRTACEFKVGEAWHLLLLLLSEIVTDKNVNGNGRKKRKEGSCIICFWFFFTQWASTYQWPSARKQRTPAVHAEAEMSQFLCAGVCTGPHLLVHHWPVPSDYYRVVFSMGHSEPDGAFAMLFSVLVPWSLGLGP